MAPRKLGYTPDLKNGPFQQRETPYAVMSEKKSMPTFMRCRFIIYIPCLI